MSPSKTVFVPALTYFCSFGLLKCYIIQTYTFQRVHDKKDVYNLNEEEELTHYGQSLAEMEKFNDLVNSDDESEEKGLLSGEYK